jgi:purine-nucleoside phosphorylase
LLINKNIALGLFLGSGIELNESILNNKKVISEERTGVHNKQVFECIINGKHVLVFKGRKHFYEGYSRDAVTENIRFAFDKGVRNILLTNAAGGLNDNFSVGDLMLITSYINFIDKLASPRKTYKLSSGLNEIIKRSAKKMKIRISEGVYGCYPGPMYETKAEVEFQKRIPIDAAGMSTVPELYEAANLGIKTSALSVITNLLKQNALVETSHEDVIRAANLASGNLNLLLPEVLSELN